MCGREIKIRVGKGVLVYEKKKKRKGHRWVDNGRGVFGRRNRVKSGRGREGEVGTIQVMQEENWAENRKG